MNLHYSQTDSVLPVRFLLFYYLMNLHYSQTGVLFDYPHPSFTTLWIYTILKHKLFLQSFQFVLLPYEFTLFSNPTVHKLRAVTVLLPYEFTLFSNKSFALYHSPAVLLPYEFTLFSNNKMGSNMVDVVLLPYEFTLFSNCMI